MSETAKAAQHRLFCSSLWRPLWAPSAVQARQMRKAVNKLVGSSGVSHQNVHMMPLRSLLRPMTLGSGKDQVRNR